jgi:hypothetical protein
MANRLTQPSPSDFDRWEQLVLEGQEPSTAAKQLGFTCSRFRFASPERHAQILEGGKEARAGYVDERVEVRALEEDAAPAILLAWARRWNRAYTERQEISGPEGEPITFELPAEKLAEAAEILRQARGAE